MHIAFFGSNLGSAQQNGAAHHYRAIIQALTALGHQISFFEPKSDRPSSRRAGIPHPGWARVTAYSVNGADGDDDVHAALEQARSADLIVKASGTGAFDGLLDQAVPDLSAPNRAAVFWDAKPRATLARIEEDPRHPLREQLPRYDLVVTYGGGPGVVRAYRSLGARGCVPIHGAVDPGTHHPVPRQNRFEGDLGYLGDRLPERESRFDDLFLQAAAARPDGRFLLGGTGWEDRPRPGNVRYVGRVDSEDQNAFHGTVGSVLDISPDSPTNGDYSPSARVFEAAGAGACLITDGCPGLARFFEPDREVLSASSAAEVIDRLGALDPKQRRRIGGAAWRRVLSEHTYRHRAKQLVQVLDM